jgi:hypothetical protein
LGGTYNSLLPAFFGLFAAIRPVGLTVLLIPITLFAHIGSAIHTAYTPHGAPYPLADIRQLSGKFVCPEDPFVVVMANGEAGDSMFLQYDATTYQELPGLDLNADYVIQVKKTPYPFLTDEKLGGFQRDRDLGGYQVWRRISDSRK